MLLPQSALQVTQAVYFLGGRVNKSYPGIDVLASHGLQRSRQDQLAAHIDTWVEAGSGECWILDWLPDDLDIPGCSPASYNILSSSLDAVVSPRNFQTLQTLGNTLRNSLVPYMYDVKSRGEHLHTIVLFS